MKWACIYVGTPIGGDHVRRRQGRGGGSERGKALPLSLTPLDVVAEGGGFGVCFPALMPLQIGKGRFFSCVVCVLCIDTSGLFPRHGVSDVPMQAS